MGNQQTMCMGTVQDLSPLSPYPLKSFPRGYAIVINMRFSDQPDEAREGSEVDVRSLEDLFNELHFSVEVYRDLTSTGLSELLDEISHREDLAKHDAFILAVMSHGGEGYIEAVDRKAVPIIDIITRFRNDKCTHLKGKPKFLIVQACRGHARDPGVSVLGGYDATMQTYKISSAADFLVAYATPPDYVSWRDAEKGSWFIQALASVFRHRAHNTNVLDMLTHVCAFINDKETARGYKMCPEFTSTLRFPLFLKKDATEASNAAVGPYTQ